MDTPQKTYPNWFVKGVPIPDGVLPCVSVPVHGTIDIAKANGAVEGTMLVAPLVPESGSITAPAGSLVVAPVKTFWNSPSVKAARNIVGAALVAVIGVFSTACFNVWTHGQSIFATGAINWSATLVTAQVAAGLIISSAILSYIRTTDHSPIAKSV